MTEQEARAVLEQAGYQVVRWRCTGYKTQHHGPDEGKGSEFTFGLWWMGERRYVLDGLRAPKP